MSAFPSNFRPGGIIITDPANELMLREALSSVRSTRLLRIIQEHIEGRDDINPNDLEIHSNIIRREAWNRERSLK